MPNENDTWPLWPRFRSTRASFFPRGGHFGIRCMSVRSLSENLKLFWELNLNFINSRSKKLYQWEATHRWRLHWSGATDSLFTTKDEQSMHVCIYLSNSFFSPLNAATVRMEERTSSATLAAFAYASSSWVVYADSTCENVSYYILCTVVMPQVLTMSGLILCTFKISFLFFYWQVKQTTNWLRYCCCCCRLCLSFVVVSVFVFAVADPDVDFVVTFVVVVVVVVDVN